MQWKANKQFFLLLVTVEILLTASVEMTPLERKEKTKVLILGAGAAGLAAAKTLSENGITDFIILEGSDRIGGRVKSVPFGGKTVEAGANWIVGKRNNPLFDIARDLNIQGKASDWESVVIRNSEGVDVTESEGDDAWSKLGEAVENLQKINESVDLGSFDMSTRSCLDMGKWRPKTPVEKVVEIYQHDYEFAHLPGVSSCLNVINAGTFLGDTFYVRDERGYQSILLNYVKDVVSENDARLYHNQIVTEIKHNDQEVEVTTEAGSIFKADYAIITFGIGVLKSDAVTFKPELPDWKIYSLFRMRFESYIGIYMKFPDTMARFWDDEEFILYADERRGYYPIWQNLEADNLHPSGTNILEIVTFGEEANRVSQLSKMNVTTEIMEMLRRVYKNPQITDPEDVFIAPWINDPLYRGSFCSVEPGADEPEVFKNRTAPVGRLYFAGEAYDREMSGYVLGALRSGNTSTLEIIQNLK